jgi:hypothetical protein
LAALVHPIRISDGTISASLDAWPDDLSHRRTQGEIALGTVLDINLQPDPNNVHRFRADELMHAVIVGDSGSGQSPTPRCGLSRRWSMHCDKTNTVSRFIRRPPGRYQWKGQAGRRASG